MTKDIFAAQYSVELRELEAKLKAGYMNRERAAQLAEKRVLEIDEQVSRNLQFILMETAELESGIAHTSY